MKIAFVSAELYPYAKVGGLADVSASLPKALKNINTEVKIFIPAYFLIKENYQLDVIKKKIELRIGGEIYNFSILRTRLFNSIDVFLVESEYFFDREKIYGYEDDVKRFAFFCKSVLGTLKIIDYKPDIIHTNDWQTAFVPIYLKTLFKRDPFFSNTKSLFTIHNLGYQGIFPQQTLKDIDIPDTEFHIEGLEFYGKINFLKGGIVYSDWITTVSEQYSKEIQEKEFGEGLDGLIKSRSYKLTGILNGIDGDEFNPLTDKKIAMNYSRDNLDGKKVCKEDLRELLKLSKGEKDIPIIGLISRLVSQKGMDILLPILRDLSRMELQLVILGTGDEYYNKIFAEESKRYKKKFSINLKFDENLARKIYAGSDFFLMPSKYEPCGLGQMIALRYGTIPIVHSTGGLKDTVVNFDLKKLSGNGFCFDEYSSSKLFQTIKRALEVYKNKKVWTRIVENAMKSDFSWKSSAHKYKNLYLNLINKE